MNKKTTLVKRLLLSLLNKKTLFLSCFFLCTINMVSQTYYTDDSDLRTAVNSSTNGGEFIVRNGTYNDFEPSFEIMATEEHPIIIKAETVGGVILTGDSHFTFKKCAYITLEGFVINGTGSSSLVKTEGCNNIRITRNVFELATTDPIKWVFIGGVYNDNTQPFVYPSHHNRIDHNIFKNKTTPGHYITIDGTTDSNDNAYQSQYDRIDHNYFKNNGPRAVNEQESIRIGWSEMSKSSGYTTVEFNLFEDCDGDPEIVSVKSSDNIIRHNTFRKSYGTLSLRHGNRNRVEGNYFFGEDKAITTSPDGATLYTGGVRIYGKDHVIINNYMEGLTGTRWDAPITLTMGDAIDGQSSDLTKHYRAENVVIAYNTLVNNSHGIEIGYDNNDKYSKDVANITIANNLITGSENSLVEIVDTNNDQGNNITWTNNLMYPTAGATLLTGATSTSFDNTNVRNENPFLALDNSSGVWKTTVSTPNYSNTITTETINTDIEGQTRTTSSNPGADHFSQESVRYSPLTASDVGPDVYEIDDTSESLYLSSISEFIANGDTKEISITSNVDWSITDDSDWISINPASGSNNGTFNVIVAKNNAFTSRTGTVTVTGGTLTRNLSIHQQAANPKDGLELINDGTTNDKVTVHSVFHEEVTSTKNNIASHSLDKDVDTQWSGQGTPGEIIYNLGGTYDLALIDYASTNGKRYEFQIWTSSTGTNSSDFTNAFPNSGNLVCETQNDAFTSYILPTTATEVKYVKIIGYGQPERPSEWNTITEIEFYRSGNLAATDIAVNNIHIFPIPATTHINLKNLTPIIQAISIYSIDHKKIIEQTLPQNKTNTTINVSTLSNGVYILNLLNNNNIIFSKKIIINH